jgi:hypothetical protein
MKTAIPQTIQGWLIRLYTSESKLARMKDQHAPQEKIEKARAWLRSQWEQASALGVSEKLFSAYGEALYLEDVSLALDYAYRDACACHAKHVECLSRSVPNEPGMVEQMDKSAEWNYKALMPCAHFDDSGCCSPFCPKFKAKK